METKGVIQIRRREMSRERQLKIEKEVREELGFPDWSIWMSLETGMVWTLSRDRPPFTDAEKEKFKKKVLQRYEEGK
jgi:hypothetical protein